MPRRAISADVSRAVSSPARRIEPVSGDDDAGERLEQGRLAGAVAAEQRDDLVLGDIERHRVEDVALAVERVDLVDGEQRCGACRRRRRLRLHVRGPGADIDLAHARVVACGLDAAVDQHLAIVHHRDDVGDLKDTVDVVLDQQHGDLL